ncbi:MAG: family hydrolase, partial [Rhizobacter sp.]|nr:family hydrolase [Rhizobacter sp.]
MEAGAVRIDGPAVFLDKDGTLVEDVPYNVDPAKLRFTPGAIEGLRLMASHGYKLIVVTNQPGVAMGLFGRADLMRLERALTGMLRDEGVELAGFFACTHAPSNRPGGGCLCRKPAPGLLRQAALAHKVDLKRSWMVGDILNDIEAGQRAGCRTVLLDVGNETEWRLSPLRTPHLRVADLLDAARAIVSQPQPLLEPEQAIHVGTSSRRSSVDNTHAPFGPGFGPLSRNDLRADAIFGSAKGV